MFSLQKKLTPAFVSRLLLLVIPILWCFLSFIGLLDFFEDRTIDWRFRQRGEIDVPVNVFYVDIDSRSIGALREWPWSRHYVAAVADALVNHAHVKAVGFDIVFSPEGIAESADLSRLQAGDFELDKVVNPPGAAAPPPVVFAASYSAREFRTREGKLKTRTMPTSADDHRKPEEIEPPEETAIEFRKGAFRKPPYVGLIDTFEGGTRTVSTWVSTQTIDYFHMAIELARLYWGLPADAIKLLPNPQAPERMDFVRPDGRVQASIPLREKRLLDVNWFTKWNSKLRMSQSFVEVYDYAMLLRSKDGAERKEAQEYFAQEAWKDAIVLIGPTDPLRQDLAVTPMDDAPVPKVGVHGNLLKTIITGKFLRRPPQWGDHAIVFGLTILIAALFFAGGKRVVAGLIMKVVAVLAGGAYVVLTFWWFSQSHLVLPFVAPLGAAVTTTGYLFWRDEMERRRMAQEREREERARANRVQGMFGTYLSPQLVERMVESREDPKLGGHDAVITAYFSDIQSFSKFSELLGSEKLVELMNEYLTACTDILTSQGGTLDKYIGDAVVAMYGAPVELKDHAFRACVTTQLVQKKLGELRVKWKAEGDKWPPIVWNMQTRIGLNTGKCTIGNMGSASRFCYTMMGDDVNLAARMESAAKSWGVYTMITEETRRQACEHGGDRVVFRPLGRIQVMGREQAVPIYEIVGLKEALPPTALECIGIFSQGLEKLYARDWDGAIALFEQSKRLEPNQPGLLGIKTNPSFVLIEHAEDYKLTPPPENWDGRYVMESK